MCIYWKIPHPPPGEISADISLGEKYEKGEEINEENVKEKGEKTWDKGKI